MSPLAGGAARYKTSGKEAAVSVQKTEISTAPGALRRSLFRRKGEAVLRTALLSSFCLLLLSHAAFYPAAFSAMLAKDGVDGGGVFEHLTVAACIPGIFAGLAIVARRLHSRERLWYVAAWTAALVYFAGEEASWGQWYFGWQTPESFLPFNDQGETNLHNVSSWLDQKPRILVEFFVFAAGFALPLYYAAGGKKKFWDMLVLPASFCPWGAIFILSRIGDWLPANEFLARIGDSEFREFIIACFLSDYIAHLFIRAKNRKGR